MKTLRLVRLPLILTALALAVFVAAFSAACGGGSPTSPSSTQTYAPAQDPATATTLTYTKDVQPILSADCTSCHNSSRRDGGYDLSTYSGVMRAVSAGSTQSVLVRATQPGGVMYVHFRGSASTKADTVRRWVVEFAAAQ